VRALALTLFLTQHASYGLKANPGPHYQGLCSEGRPLSLSLFNPTEFMMQGMRYHNTDDKYRCVGRRIQNIMDEELPFTGSLTMQHYLRSVCTQLPPPPHRMASDLLALGINACKLPSWYTCIRRFISSVRFWSVHSTKRSSH
jgi:hypothetical protein